MYGPDTLLENHGWFLATFHTFNHGRVVKGNEITSTRPDESTRFWNDWLPALAGAANNVDWGTVHELTHWRLTSAPACRVTSVMNARPTCTSSGLMPGSLRENVRSWY